MSTNYAMKSPDLRDQLAPFLWLAGKVMLLHPRTANQGRRLVEEGKDRMRRIKAESEIIP